MRSFTDNEIIDRAIHKGIAAALVLIVATVALAAADGGAATETEDTGTVVVDALQVGDLGAGSSRLGDVPFRIEPIGGDGGAVAGRTRANGPASVDVGPGDYWVTIDRSGLEGVPCSGSDRVMVRVVKDVSFAVAAFDTTTAPIGLDPVCMAAMALPSGPTLDPCLTELDAASLTDQHLACAEEWGLERADLLVRSD
ncbi:MAG: hypothetical protein AAGD18_08215 [Actinomycetota bacterium]